MVNIRFRSVEGALELSLVAIGLVLLIVGWTNYYATVIGNCVSHISCLIIYDLRYSLMFFAGIIVTIIASAGLTWNFLSHARGQSATVRPVYSNFDEDAV